MARTAAASRAASSAPRKTAGARVIWWAVAFTLMAYAAIAVAAYLAQERLLYYPDRSRPTASTLGIPGLEEVEEVELHAEGALTLLAWHVPAATGRPTIAYFHGNGGNLAHRADRIRAFAQAGLGVMMVEYPGYGGNPGRPSEAGLLGAARAALARLEDIGVGPRSFVLYGESIGTAIATRMAVERPAAGLILESPYTSLLDLARLRFWFLPARLLLRDRFEQLSMIPKARAPLLVLLGARDAIVPPGMSHAVFEAARAPKALWVAPGGGHNDLAAHGALERAIAFATSLCGRPATQCGMEASNDAAAGGPGTAAPAQPRQEAREGMGRRGIMAGVRRGMRHAEGIGFVVLMAFSSRAAARKARRTGEQQAARNPSPLWDAINAALDERRRNGGLGPSVGPGVDISALFAPYIRPGMTVEEAASALHAANLAVQPPYYAGQGMPKTLRAGATLARTAFTTTQVAVVAVLEMGADGGERVAQVKSALSWSAP